MPRYDDIDPQDIDPETNAPYANYSSPALDTSFHDQEMDVDDEDACTDRRGHEWAYTGTQYGGDDERWQGEGRCHCVHCGADGDG